MKRLASHTSGTGTAVSFLHGFTQTRSSWQPLLDHITVPIRATLLDAPDHGESHVSLTLHETADVLREMCAGEVLVGYSMGARMALVAAVRNPTAFRGLVLISGTAGLDTLDERTQRVASDTDLAEHILRIGVPAFIAEWLALPMFSGLTTETARIPDRLTNTAEGLASSLRLCGTGTQEPMWNSLPHLNVPILIIAGENDTKFSAIAHRLHALLPTSTLHIHPNVGHTVHLEDPIGCANVISQWLLQHEL